MQNELFNLFLYVDTYVTWYTGKALHIFIGFVIRIVLDLLLGLTIYVDDRQRGLAAFKLVLENSCMCVSEYMTVYECMYVCVHTLVWSQDHIRSISKEFVHFFFQDMISHWSGAQLVCCSI